MAGGQFGVNMSKSDAGKGDDVRPRFITGRQWAANHRLAFGKPRKPGKKGVNKTESK